MPARDKDTDSLKKEESEKEKQALSDDLTRLTFDPLSLARSLWLLSLSSSTYM